MIRGMKKIKTLYVSSVLLFTCSVSFADVFNSEDNSVELNDKLRSVIEEFNPSFRLYNFDDYAPKVRSYYKDAKNILPMAVEGDFNGDRKLDIALMGYVKDEKPETHILMILDYKESPSLHVVRSAGYYDPNTVVKLPANEDGDLEEQNGLIFYLSRLSSDHLEFPEGKVSSDALQLEIWGSSTTSAHVFRGDRVQPSSGIYIQQ